MYKILKTLDNTLPVDEYSTYKRFGLNQTEEEKAAEAVYIDPREEILGDALKQAEEILESARTVADQIRQEAFEEGSRNGEEAGYQEGVDKAYKEHQLILEEKNKMLEQEIADYVKDMEIEKQKVLEEYMDDLKNIALAIGEKIVQVSLRSSSEVIEKMILSATERLKKTAWAKIYVGKNGEQLQINGDSRLLQELSKLSDNVKIIVMDEEEPGTCIVELPDEIIDISVGTQLENIKEIMNNARI